ncbi:MAG: DoxX family protein [Bacteroidetes bacterium]|nr:MAG: DoxX family protein [Bacteroidota bacterium]
MNKRDRIIFTVVTALFSAHMLFTVVAYIFMHDMVSEMFVSLGVSPSIIYPLAIAKVLGLIAIWTNKSRILKELAYLGFATDFVLAIAFHLKVADGGAVAAMVALVMLIVSYIFGRKRSQNANVSTAVE